MFKISFLCTLISSFFFFLVTQGIRTSLLAPQLISGPTEHPASPVGRWDTAGVTDVHAETRTQVTEARKPYICRWATTSMHVPSFLDQTPTQQEKKKSFSFPVFFHYHQATPQYIKDANLLTLHILKNHHFLNQIFLYHYFLNQIFIFVK